MDVLRKFLNLKKDESNETKQIPSIFGNEFRKPMVFDDCESDDELSERKGFQIFTNPMEMQKYFEQQMLEQMQEILKSVEGFDDKMIDEDIREKFLKPGFEEFRKDLCEPKKSIDTDLDDEIYADQLHSLLQRISPESELSSSSNMKSYVDDRKKVKRTDEETIWDRIHGTFVDDSASKQKYSKQNQQTLKKLPHSRGGGVFEGAFQGPKVFRQSVMVNVIRKPDGSSETRRTVRDADGNENTTVTTRTKDGQVHTFNSTTGGDNKLIAGQQPIDNENRILSILQSDRNMYVTKAGYAVPKIW